ncbi:MAG: tetratricopeptide repeat protein [Treponema sp.]|nr:tetratricopeptide repeat protein [Treponema sp.]
MKEFVSSVTSERPVINEPFDRLPERDLGERDDGERGRAREKRRKAAPKKKRILETRLMEGARLFNEGRWDEALAELLLAGPTDMRGEERNELSYYMGLCFAKLEKHEDALPCLESVVARESDPLRICQCRMTLAYIHAIEDRPKMAEFEATRILKAGFESAVVFNMLAYAAYAGKRFRNAVDYYQKALRIEDGNATALNSLGFILADTGMDPLKGLKFCRRAVELQPENAAYLDSLGWAYYKCRETVAARDWLRKALDLAPEAREIQEHLRIVMGGLK